MRVFLAVLAVVFAGCVNVNQSPKGEPASDGASPTLDVVHARRSSDGAVELAFYLVNPTTSALRVAAEDFRVRDGSGAEHPVSRAGALDASSARSDDAPIGGEVPAGRERFIVAQAQVPSGAAGPFRLVWRSASHVAEASLADLAAGAPPVRSGPRNLSVSQVGTLDTDGACAATSAAETWCAKFSVVSVSANFAQNNLKVTDATTSTGAITCEHNGAAEAATAIAAGDTIVCYGTGADAASGDKFNFIDESSNTIVATITIA